MKRYGRFEFKDYWGAWIGILCYLILAISVSWAFKLLFIVLAFAKLMTVIIPHTERYRIENNIIYTKKLCNKSNYILPQNITIVISYADISYLLAQQSVTNFAKQSYKLHGKYAITIVKQMSSDELTNSIHKLMMKQYTNSAIEYVMKYISNSEYIYSFVYNEELIDELTQNYSCNIIVPESIVDNLEIPNNNVSVYIDFDH